MRLAELRSGADPARADNEKNLRQNEIPQRQRLFESCALFFNIAFCAIEFADHAPNCRACALLAHRKLPDGAPVLQRLMPTVQAFAAANASTRSQRLTLLRF